MENRKIIFTSILIILITGLSIYGFESGAEKGAAARITEVIDGCGGKVEVDMGTDKEEAMQLAQNWIKDKSATYRERSDRGKVELIEKKDYGEGEYRIIFEFTTHDNGFGSPEEGEEVKEGEFQRTAKIIMYYDHVSMVVIDNEWCDRDRKKVTETEVENWTRPLTEEEIDSARKEREAAVPPGVEIITEETIEENGKTIRKTEVKYENEGEIVTQRDYIDAPTGEIESERVIRDIDTNEIIREIEDWTEIDEETGEVRMRKLTVHEEGEYRISRVIRDGDDTVSEITTYDLETEEALKERIIENRMENDKIITIETTLNLQTREETVERIVQDLQTGEIVEEEILE